MRTLGTALVALCLVVMGCAALPQPTPPPEAFQHGVSSSHVELYWTCSAPAPGVLEVDGIAQNRWAAQEVRFLEFDLVGVNDRDRTVSDARADLPAILLHTNEVSPFRLTLKTAGTEARYDLYYQYLFNEGDLTSALEPAPVQLFAQQLQRFMARDACGSHQH